MNGSNIIWSVLTGLAGVGAGLLLGAAYFANLRRACTHMIVKPSPPAVVASILARIGAAALVFFFLTRWGGGVAAIGGLAGFTLARHTIVARTERGP